MNELREKQYISVEKEKNINQIREVNIKKVKKHNIYFKFYKIENYILQIFNIIFMIFLVGIFIFMFKPIIDLNYEINKTQNDIYMLKKHITKIEVEIEEINKDIQNFITLESLEKYAIDELDMVKLDNTNRIIIDGIEKIDIDEDFKTY